MDKKKVERAVIKLKANGAFAAMNQEAIDLLEEALAPKSRFYKGQPVLVQNEGGTGWKYARYEKYYHPTNQHQVITSVGCTNYEPASFLYDCCTPDPDAESLPAWIEHDGSKKIIEIPLGNDLIWVHINGQRELISGALEQNALHADNEVARYAIIPLPEFL